MDDFRTALQIDTAHMTDEQFTAHIEDVVEAINYAVADEGWGIYFTTVFSRNGADLCRYELQRVDDMNVFDDDEQAIAYVRELAEAGCEVHALAIQIIE